MANTDSQYTRNEPEKKIQIIIQKPYEDKLLRRLMTNILGYFKRMAEIDNDVVYMCEEIDDQWKVRIGEMTRAEADERAKERAEKKDGKKADGE